MLLTWWASAWQMLLLLATSLVPIVLEERGIKTRVDDVAGNICQPLLSAIWKTATRGTGSIRDANAFAEALRLAAAELAALELEGLRGTSSAGSKNIPPSSSASLAGGPPSFAGASPGGDMTAAQRAKYLAHFHSIDTDGDGYISNEEAGAFLSKAKLSKAGPDTASPRL